jgi:hypothetical protein
MCDQSEKPDPAAIFSSALSLWTECHKRTSDIVGSSPGDVFNGTDEFMRVVMRVATRFEEWASCHVAFDEINDVWARILECRFGPACMKVLDVESLMEFDDRSCLRIALHLEIPVRPKDGLPIPVDERAANPISNSLFQEFRIQTVRESKGEESYEPLTIDDDPYDERFHTSHFALYGIGDDGLLEHIADRPTYALALSLARKIAPFILFPDVPTLRKTPVFDPPLARSPQEKGETKGAQRRTGEPWGDPI